MPETYTIDEVRALLNMVVSGIRCGFVEDRVFSLEEVAERTHWSLETLQNDCAAEPARIHHTKRGRRRGMTSSQIAELINKHSVGAEVPSWPSSTSVRPGNARSSATRSTLSTPSRRR